MKKGLSILLVLCMVLSVFVLPAGPMVTVVSADAATAASDSATWPITYMTQMPSAIREKGLKILLPRELNETEQDVVDDFVKKSGCHVDVIVTTEREYPTKLISMISAGNSPDICMLQSEGFPGVVTKALQSLDRQIFRLDDDFWYKPYMDAFSINGRYFSVAVRGSWSCEEGNYVTYYLPKVLKGCGIMTMPYDLYKDGKWDWEAQHQMVSTIKAANKGYYGISWQYKDAYMLSAGQDFATYDGAHFKNKIATDANGLLLKSWQEVSGLRDASLCVDWDLTTVIQGKVALFTTGAYGMHSQSSFGFDDLPGGAASIEAVPVAGPKGLPAYIPVSPKTWGVPKGAKNVEGAAYFLRYFLDSDNYDLSNTFLNPQCKAVYEIITAASAKKQIRYGRGVADYVTSGTYDSVCGVLSSATSANMATVMNNKKNSVNTGVVRANKDFNRLCGDFSPYFDNDCDTDCNVCGYVRTIEHEYSSACDEQCDICNAVRTEDLASHTDKITTTKATTSKNGSIVTKCSTCGKNISTKTIYYAKSFSLSTTSYTYNGKVKTPSITVKDSKGKSLKKDTDYTVSYPSGRKNVGTYKVKVTLKGNYTGSKTLTFTINPKIKLSTTKYTYNGKAKTPSVKVTNSSGKKLSTKYYSVSYSKGRKKVGTYTVTVKFKNGHSGTYKQTFTIVPKGTSVSKLKAAKKSLKVSIKKQSSQTSGYEIQYSTSKKFSSPKSKTTTKTSYTIKSLKAKKTYYVRVRTYKTVGGKKYYSGWSSAKSMKTK